MEPGASGAIAQVGTLAPKAEHDLKAGVERECNPPVRFCKEVRIQPMFVAARFLVVVLLVEFAPRNGDQNG